MRRRAVLRTVTVGLLNFMARDGLPASLTLEVESEGEEAARQPTRDPWNFWVFSVGADAQYEEEESSLQTNWELEATADRVTDDWKISFGASIQEERERFDLDEDEPREFISRERRFDWFLAKSLGSHWSSASKGTCSHPRSRTSAFVQRRAGHRIQRLSLRAVRDPPASDRLRRRR